MDATIIVYLDDDIYLKLAEHSLPVSIRFNIE